MLGSSSTVRETHGSSAEPTLLTRPENGICINVETSSQPVASGCRSPQPEISASLLKGSWDLVTRVIIRVTILITPIKVLITHLLSPMIL